MKDSNIDILSMNEWFQKYCYTEKDRSELIAHQPDLLSELVSLDGEIFDRLIKLYPNDFRQIILQFGIDLFCYQEGIIDSPEEYEAYVRQYPKLIRFFYPDPNELENFHLVNALGRDPQQYFGGNEIILNGKELEKSDYQFECLKNIAAEYEPIESKPKHTFYAISNQSGLFLGTCRVLQIDSRHLLLSDLVCRQGFEGTGVIFRILSQVVDLFPANMVWIAYVDKFNPSLERKFACLGFDEHLDTTDRFIYGVGNLSCKTMMNSIIK